MTNDEFIIETLFVDGTKIKSMSANNFQNNHPHGNRRTHCILGVTNSTMKTQTRHALALIQFSSVFLVTQQRQRLACSDALIDPVQYYFSAIRLASLVNALFICMIVRPPLSSRTITNHLVGLPSNWQLPFYCCLTAVACFPPRLSGNLSYIPGF